MARQLQYLNDLALWLKETDASCRVSCDRGEWFAIVFRGPVSVPSVIATGYGSSLEYALREALERFEEVAA